MDSIQESPSNLFFHNAHPAVGDAKKEILSGLSGVKKQLSPKWLYDEEGSKLFEKITRLPEYYPTKTETSIIRNNKNDIKEICGEGCVLIEPGSGNCEKVQFILSDLQPSAYVPLDISADFLLEATTNLANEYPWLPVYAICADFNQGWPFFEDLPQGKRIFFYPGSTIGNLEPEEARSFLAKVRAVAGDDGGMLVGVDLHKCQDKLKAAYNDSQGVTAEFNLNGLSYVSDVLGVPVDLNMFSHRALYNEECRRIEMHLVSEEPYEIRGEDFQIRFERGESIHTESSYKYTVDSFKQLAADAGFTLLKTWLDQDELYSVHYLLAS